MIKEYTTIRLKKETINLLDGIMQIKIKEAIENKTFNIMELIKRKRISPYDIEVSYLSEVWLTIHKSFKELPKQQKNKCKTCIMYNCLNKIKKINCIF